MGKGHSFLQRLSEENEIGTPGMPLVEISGQHRVLIENHYGVRAYSRESIMVNVKFGWVTVCGCGLELARMTREQLVIRGRIDGVSLQRRG